MNDPWSVAGKIVETIDSLHGVAALREEVARLKAIKAKQTGEITGLKVRVHALEDENERLRNAGGNLEVELRKTLAYERDNVSYYKGMADRLGGEVERLDAENERLRTVCKGRHDELDLTKTLHGDLADEVDRLEAEVAHKARVAEQISANNATLREQLEDQRKAAHAYRDDNIDLRDAVNEVRRVLDALNEED